MTGPITQPGELSRIASSDYEYRISMLTHAATMEAWVRSHEKQDDERHSEILDDIEDLMLRSMTVSSSISKGEKEYAKLNGMKVAAVMFFGAFATIAGLIVAWFHK